MKKIKLSLSLFTLCGLLLSGCKFDGNNTNTTINGTIIDGYISGATVCLDLNHNNICENNETKTITNEKGQYSFDLPQLSNTELESAQLISFNGTDLITDKEFEGILKSPLIKNQKNININYITTIIADSIENNNDYNLYMEKVSDTLGLTNKEANNNFYEIGFKFNKLQELLKKILSDDEFAKYQKLIKNNINNGIYTPVEDIVNNLEEIKGYKKYLIFIINNLKINNTDNLNTLKEKYKQFENSNNTIVNISNNNKGIKLIDINKSIKNNNVIDNDILNKLIVIQESYNEPQKVILHKFLDILDLSLFYTSPIAELNFPELFNLNINENTTLLEFENEIKNIGISNMYTNAILSNLDFLRKVEENSQ